MKQSIYQSVAIGNVYAEDYSTVGAVTVNSNTVSLTATETNYGSTSTPR
jgi:hypothetical protein